jgi:hypothetical protein
MMIELSRDDLSMITQALQKLSSETFENGQKDIIEKMNNDITLEEFDARKKWYENHREYLSTIIKKVKV